MKLLLIFLLILCGCVYVPFEGEIIYPNGETRKVEEGFMWLPEGSEVIINGFAWNFSGVNILGG